ncbi:hypothetical protein SAMN05443633_11599 [Chryseobacterium arachidis]|uniref:Uncharacterized protein n=2 Tax=Chryseobacterium arachidis TaxID=1416778 RepID=A0A1M5JVQ4_9FLAO|nr:hypothetical protein [Chryseobacterium arachidis]SHG44626.1 hypothetical protein SAMN05443633_11599 [Chryseobacterium arachidis]
MTDFVIEYYANEGYADLQTLNLMKNYAQLLKKDLTLGMFIPVDSNGQILKEPQHYENRKSFENNSSKTDDLTDNEAINEYKLYQKARKKCIFEGFKLAYNGYSVVRIEATYNPAIELSFTKNDLLPQVYTDVESLLHFDEIYLNTTALKKIGINK